ncbi:hypothetical protein [Marisediminicola sp. LYQ134]|uniref:hypothetical protein n=1 Tax=unclassified Marisediminicola TaxID=2618316 RepID=UPI00398389DE
MSDPDIQAVELDGGVPNAATDGDLEAATNDALGETDATLDDESPAVDSPAADSPEAPSPDAV